jgi:trehalose 6-phosphate synthase
VRAMAGAAGNQARVERLRQSLRGRDLIIGVDRLDYSKGLTQRFQAFEYLMEYHPEHRGQVVLLQIAPPSREEVAEYSEIREELQNEAGRINGRFAEFDWVPIRYLNRGFPRDALSAFFRHARVGLVTPMRDGMNLVAKEYFAAQSGSSPGVLVLSRFAGAAEQLTSALVVNPYDREMVAANLARALDMSLNERKGRWRTAMKSLRRHDISAWRRSYLRALQRAPYSL